MFILIDGYNLLKQLVHRSVASQQERARFIGQLARYARSHKHEIYIVFDGGSYMRPTKTESDAYYSVIYSGIKESADQYIERFIEQTPVPEMLIVSTDRKIGLVARRHNIETVDSIDFYRLITIETGKNNMQQKVGASGAQPRKLSEIENPELDALMLETKRVIHKKDDEESGVGGHENRLSKKEKKLLKVLKKL